MSPLDPAFGRLQAIVDVDTATRAGWSPRDLAQAFLDGGAAWIQVRAKQMPSGEFLALADACVTIASSYRAVTIVNDRVDIARLAEASGVHLGQEDLPPRAARRVLGNDAIVGYSTHSLAQVEAALREPISYLAVGPVFGTTSKETGYAAVGLDFVAAAVALAGSTPVVAIGGITLEKAPSVLDAGAASVAIISDLLSTGDPSGRTRACLQSLAQYRV